MYEKDVKISPIVEVAIGDKDVTQGKLTQDKASRTFFKPPEAATGPTRAKTARIREMKIILERIYAKEGALKIRFVKIMKHKIMKCNTVAKFEPQATAYKQVSQIRSWIR